VTTVFGLKFNPFEIKSVSDISDFKKQPFLLLNMQKVLKLTIEMDIQQNPPEYGLIYYVILGERGIGKTTTLAFLKDIVDNCKEPYILSRYVTRPQAISTIRNLENLIVADNVVGQNSEARLSNWLEGKKVYLFIDVQDKCNKHDLNLLAEGLQNILYFKNIRVFMAMNKSHYNNMFDITEILGKYTVIDMKPFEIKHTRELIIARLNMAREQKDNDLYPFTEDSIKIIQNTTKGIPRNILVACDISLKYATLCGYNLIDASVVTEAIAKDYTERIIQERIESQHKRDMMMKLYNIIKNDFSGEVKKEEILIDHIKQKLGWSRVTTRKRIRELQKLGLIIIDKSTENMWTNVIKIVE